MEGKEHKTGAMEREENGEREGKREGGMDGWCRGCPRVSC